jgi:glycosyltransferase involved in cell wall biosynthesis
VTMLAEGLRLLRGTTEATRLVVCHRAIVPVATVLAREPNVRGMSVVCHGSEGWDAPLRPRRRLERVLMRRPEVRAVAVSSFTAGTLARGLRASVLPPAPSRQWFEMLVSAGAKEHDRSPGIQLVTAFRLASWRQKGLPQLVAAVEALGRQDVRLTICGGGETSSELRRFVADHSWCALHEDASDPELAVHFSRADLFVLATRTKPGKGASGEGFGLVLLEAQLAGTPVIAPAYGGCADAFVQGVTGVSPTDETVQALTVVLRELLEDPDRLARMSKRALEWAQERFRPDRYALQASRKLL